MEEPEFSFGGHKRIARAWVVVFTALSISSITACHSATNAGPGSIVLDREVLVRGIGGSPNSLVQTSNGQLIVAGGWGSAWAFALDERGKVAWRFDEPYDPNSKVYEQSVYRSVVPLSNGSLLLCGEIVTKNRTQGLITMLDGSGRVVEERQLIAQNNHDFFSSSFRQCLPWNGGILLAGVATNDQGAQRWLVRLDGGGAPVSERVDRQFLASSVVPNGDGTLTFVGSDVHTGQAILSRVNEQLEIVARRGFDGSGFALLRPINPTPVVKFITYQISLKATLHTLGENLKDVQPARALEPIYVDKGRGYVLPDSSLALFGYVYEGGPYTAAIASIDPSARTKSIYTFSPKFSSFTVGDVLPLGAGQFVTVRSRAGDTPAETGIVISWVNVK